MTCVPFFHRYRDVQYRHVRDVSLGEPGTLRTDILRSCDRCHKLRVRSVRGWWNAPDDVMEVDW